MSLFPICMSYNAVLFMMMERKRQTGHHKVGESGR